MPDDWAAAMRAAAGLDAAMAVAEPAEELSAPVPWQRIGAGDGRIDVQVLECGRTGRKLLLIELDAGDDETERRVLAAIRGTDKVRGPAGRNSGLGPLAQGSRTTITAGTPRDG